MNKKSKGAGKYFIFILILLGICIWISTMNKEEDSYEYNMLIEDLEAGNVETVTVQPNKETPTGVAKVELKDDTSHLLFATGTTIYSVSVSSKKRLQ